MKRPLLAGVRSIECQCRHRNRKTLLCKLGAHTGGGEPRLTILAKCTIAVREFMDQLVAIGDLAWVEYHVDSIVFYERGILPQLIGEVTQNRGCLRFWLAWLVSNHHELLVGCIDYEDAKFAHKTPTWTSNLEFLAFGDLFRALIA